MSSTTTASTDTTAQGNSTSTASTANADGSSISISINAPNANVYVANNIDWFKAKCSKFSTVSQSTSTSATSGGISITITDKSSNNTVELAASFITQLSANANAPDLTAYSIAEALLQRSDIGNAMNLSGGTWDAVSQLDYFSSMENFELYLASIRIHQGVQEITKNGCCF